MYRIYRFPVFVCLALALPSVSLADIQAIAAGTGRQDATVISSGTNGICNTQAWSKDIQAIPVGKGAPWKGEIRCGSDRVVSSVAAGDDRQLLAVGSACSSSNTAVIDTGADGIASSIAIADDNQVIPLAQGASNAACILTGANGIADTGDPIAGDDTRSLAFGATFANAAAVLCGPNGIVDTTANNVNPNGDDVQLISLGGGCGGDNTPVIDTGANGVSDSRAEGPSLVILAGKTVRLGIGSGKAGVSKGFKLDVLNREWNDSAPEFRDYELIVDEGSCPAGSVSQVDSHAGIPGVQTIASVPRGGKVQGGFVVTLKLGDVVSVDSASPYRCQIDVTARAVDTAPDVDDAVHPENNSTCVTVEGIDGNDL